ncbi:nucleotide binding protein [[Candida] boidinii]|nr:nucleotide binding protein [[Candida] boidinii]
MARDEASGKSKGFCFFKYEDQRSTALAVDNLNGVQEAETEEEEIGGASKNSTQQCQDMVYEELKTDFANVESEDEIAKYKDADKI